MTPALKTLPPPLSRTLYTNAAATTAAVAKAYAYAHVPSVCSHLIIRLSPPRPPSANTIATPLFLNTYITYPASEPRTTSADRSPKAVNVGGEVRARLLIRKHESGFEEQTRWTRIKMLLHSGVACEKSQGSRCGWKLERGEAGLEPSIDEAVDG